MTVQRFKEERPDLADLPDEVVEGLIVYQQWAFGEALDDLGRSILEGLRRLPIIGKWWERSDR